MPVRYRLAFSVAVALLTFVVSWLWLPVEPIERGIAAVEASARAALR